METPREHIGGVLEQGINVKDLADSNSAPICSNLTIEKFSSGNFRGEKVPARRYGIVSPVQSTYSSIMSRMTSGKFAVVAGPDGNHSTFHRKPTERNAITFDFATRKAWSHELRCARNVIRSSLRFPFGRKMRNCWAISTPSRAQSSLAQRHYSFAQSRVFESKFRKNQKTKMLECSEMLSANAESLLKIK